MLGRRLTSSSQDGTIKKVTQESMAKELYVCNNICLTIFVLLATAVLEDVSLTFIDKTDTSDLLKREDYWRRILKTMAPFGLHIEESV